MACVCGFNGASVCLMDGDGPSLFKSLSLFPSLSSAADGYKRKAQSR